MNLNELAQEVAHLECGKKEIDIAQIKEVIKCISILMVEHPEVIATLIKNGLKHQ